MHYKNIQKNAYPCWRRRNLWRALCLMRRCCLANQPNPSSSMRSTSSESHQKGPFCCHPVFHSWSRNRSPRYSATMAWCAKKSSSFVLSRTGRQRKTKLGRQAQTKQTLQGPGSHSSYIFIHSANWSGRCLVDKKALSDTFWLQALLA